MDKPAAPKMIKLFSFITVVSTLYLPAAGGILPDNWGWPESYEPVTVFCDDRSIDLPWQSCEIIASTTPHIMLCLLNTHLEWADRGSDEPRTSCAEVKFENDIDGSYPTHCHLLYEDSMSDHFESGETVDGTDALGIACEGFIRNQDFGAQMWEWFKEHLLNKLDPNDGFIEKRRR